MNKNLKIEYNNDKNKKRRKQYMKIIDTIALVLIIIGAINWGLIGIFNFNLVETLFGGFSILSRIVYILVGIAGLWCIRIIFTDK